MLALALLGRKKKKETFGGKTERSAEFLVISYPQFPTAWKSLPVCHWSFTHICELSASTN